MNTKDLKPATYRTIIIGMLVIYFLLEFTQIFPTLSNWLYMAYLPVLFIMIYRIKQIENRSLSDTYPAWIFIGALTCFLFVVWYVNNF